ncbi:MAG: YbhB/YbcL family Raf kinase inhibitor-like protein [Verrucomicrobiota bacterium]|jgi:Raf kinase inhibitor-like YbhB/YbcL family protein
MNTSSGRARLLAAGAVFCFALGQAVAGLGAAEAKGKGNMQLTSTAFTNGAPIPAKYTYDGKNVSPPLKWSGVPAEAKSLVLIADDPDAPVGTWVHWVVYDLPASVAELSEDVPKTQALAGGAKQGLNDFRLLGYGGPSPPPGKAHRYFFKLYALDRPLGLKPGATKKDVERAMANHLLAQTQFMGTYQRK